MNVCSVGSSSFGGESGEEETRESPSECGDFSTPAGRTRQAHPCLCVLERGTPSQPARLLKCLPWQAESWMSEKPSLPLRSLGGRQAGWDSASAHSAPSLTAVRQPCFWRIKLKAALVHLEEMGSNFAFICFRKLFKLCNPLPYMFKTIYGVWCI